MVRVEQCGSGDASSTPLVRLVGSAKMSGVCQEYKCFLLFSLSTYIHIDSGYFIMIIYVTLRYLPIDENKKLSAFSVGIVVVVVISLLYCIALHCDVLYFHSTLTIIFITIIYFVSITYLYIYYIVFKIIIL